MFSGISELAASPFCAGKRLGSALISACFSVLLLHAPTNRTHGRPALGEGGPIAVELSLRVPIARINYTAKVWAFARSSMETVMKKRWMIAVFGIPGIIVTALTTNIVSAPFDYLRNSFSSRPEIGSELRVSIPQNYPPIGGLVVIRSATGTNVDLLGR
jgi:hypothetical protein